MTATTAPTDQFSGAVAGINNASTTGTTATTTTTTTNTSPTSVHHFSHYEACLKPENRLKVTRLSSFPYVDHDHYINTPPVVVLCFRPDKKAAANNKIDYYITSPDTYPHFTVLSVWRKYREDFRRGVSDGMVIRLFAVAVNKEYDDGMDRGQHTMVRRKHKDGIGHLNMYGGYQNTGKRWAPCTEYDRDGEEVRQCRELWKRWQKDERERIEREERQRQKEEEQAMVAAAEEAERRIKEEEEERKRREEDDIEKAMADIDLKEVGIEEASGEEKMQGKEDDEGGQQEASEQEQKLAEAKEKWAKDTERLRREGNVFGPPGGPKKWWRISGYY